MGNLIDEAIKGKYKESIGHDPLAFIKDAVDWNVFPPLLSDLYHNETNKGGFSFMNFLDYPDLLPDARTIWLLRERLSTKGRDRTVWQELQRQLDSKGIKIRNGTIQDGTPRRTHD